MKTSSEFDLPLSILRESVLRATLLPRPYAQYRPLLADGLCFFLRRLSAARLRGIFTEQSRLPQATSVAARMVALLHHCPVLHKLGQVVARDRRVHVRFREHLQALESLEPRTSATAAVQLLEREFKPWRQAGIELGAQVLAEGSVALILPFTCQQSKGGNPSEGVFKLIKPGVEKRLEEDLRILSSLGEFLDEHCSRYHLPILDYRGTLETVRELLLHEIRLDEEQRHLQAAKELYAGMESVVIPALFPFRSRRFTAMQRLHGKKMTDGPPPRMVSREQLAHTAARALIARPLFSSHPTALFHADPHAGNLLVLPDGRLGILDWSLTGRLHKSHRTELMQLLLSAIGCDVERLSQAVMNLATRRPDPAAVADVLHSSLRKLGWGTLPGLAWLTRLVDALAMEARVRFGPDLLLFRKSLLTLEGVLADLVHSGKGGADTILDEAVMHTFYERWNTEWPHRFNVPFNARHFATHLSNADVFEFLCSTPIAFTRWCFELWLRNCRNEQKHYETNKRSRPLARNPARHRRTQTKGTKTP